MARRTSKAGSGHGSTTRRAVDYYKLLLKRQRELPQDLQWTMGDELRHAKAAALVETEHDTLFRNSTARRTSRKYRTVADVLEAEGLPYREENVLDFVRSSRTGETTRISSARLSNDRRVVRHLSMLNPAFYTVESGGRLRRNHHLPIGESLHVALSHPISAYENYVYTVLANRETRLPEPFVDLYLLERADGGRFALGYKRSGEVVLQTAGGRSFPVASVDVVAH